MLYLITLLPALGNRSCSAIVQVPQWDPPTQATNCQWWPLAVGVAFSQYCSGACPLVTVNEEQLGNDSVKGQCGHQMESKLEADWSSPGGLQHSLGPVGEARGDQTSG